MPFLCRHQEAPTLPLPHGFSAWEAEDIASGYDRPVWRVENEDEVRLAFSHAEQRRIACGYCCGRFRTRDVAAAVKWFHQHDCRTLEQAEAAALVLELQTLAVDRQAA